MKVLKYTVIIFLLITWVSTSYAWRMSRPITLTHPLDERQVRNLNDILQDIWNLGNGRLNLDIVTTTKSNPDNGDVWIFDDSGIMKIQARIGGTTYTWTSD